ncbi:MAG: 2Fe-2S iron-sulfur cluster-binding protein [Bacteroidetes bacterium]|nr:2Fe-2S iron-sulfur cluster-binding protein [Bacteroidota bacterium]
MKQIKIKINGKQYDLLVNSHEMLSSVIREKVGLTGTKIGCEQGSCGACTVLVNKEPVLSCITPALRYDGAEITTIEGVSKNGELHRLQEKFVEKGAIQCGFCTPGMIITSLDFLDKNPNPTEHEIRDALSGNVCRCTGYKKIVEAVAEYADEKNGKPKKVKIAPTTKGTVGVGRPYIEATKKVQGIADYADDYKLKDALHVRFVRSLHAHARILSIDASEALAYEGVRYVATGKELPITFGVLPLSQDEEAIAIDKTRYAGEIVAAVAADTDEIAAYACKLIKVKYEQLKAFLTIDESLNDIGTAEKIHNTTKFNNNIHKKAELRFGDQQQ